MKAKVLFLSLFIAAVGTMNCRSEIKLPAIIGDHMVLQQQTNANIWGWADANKNVTITCSWNNKSYTTKSDSKGKWLQAVETPAAGGPYEITISDGKELKISDVLIGEVWLCSGQSNMEMPVAGFGGGQYTEGSQEYIMKARPSRPIRMAQLDKEFSTTPYDDCKAKWMTNNPESVEIISAAAYFFADYVQEVLEIPVGIIVTCWGGSSIETWMDSETLRKVNPSIDLSVLKDKERYSKNPQNQPTLLYNAMILPIKDYTFKGAIWYQGESNRGGYKMYPPYQKAMVELWRKTFKNPDMPYYYTQIAPYCYDGNEKNLSGYFYEAQAQSLKEISNSGMAVTVDIGEERYIHPAKKRQVGERLAMCALGQTYKMPIKYQSPMYASMEVDGGCIIVNFDNCDKGLHNGLGRFEKIVGFEIAGEDKVFHAAEAKILGNKGCKSVSVSSVDVPHPVAVRYCFRNYQPGYLYNHLDLPVAPFRTDNWE